MDGELKLDPTMFSIVIIDPLISYREDKHFHCNYCGKWLFSMNRKFAVATHGSAIVAGVDEVPLNVFRMVRKCGQCRHYYIIYLDGASQDL